MVWLSSPSHKLSFSLFLISTNILLRIIATSGNKSYSIELSLSLIRWPTCSVAYPLFHEKNKLYFFHSSISSKHKKITNSQTKSDFQVQQLNTIVPKHNRFHSGVMVQELPIKWIDFNAFIWLKHNLIKRILNLQNGKFIQTLPFPTYFSRG